MAIFPIEMPHAADLAGHGHAFAPAVHTHDATDTSAPCEDHGAAATEHASDGSHGEEGLSCCGTTACHAFQVSSTPDVGARLPVIGILRVACDHQVPGVRSGRLERPPRTF